MSWNKLFDTLDLAYNWSQSSLNEPVLGSRASSVRKKIRMSQIRIKNLLDSSKQYPTFGIYGPSQAGKSYLSSKLAEDKNGKLTVQLNSDCDFLAKINPEGGRESTALVTRFSVGREKLNKAFPVSAALMSDSDIICLLANSFNKDSDAPLYPGTEKIIERLSELNLNTAPVSSAMPLDDILNLENYLDKHVFDKATNENFGEIWTYLTDNYLFLDLAERAKLFSLLWSDNPHLTELYTLLSDFRGKIGGNQAVLLPEDCLLPRETSIIDVDILRIGLIKKDTSQVVQLLNSDGQEVEIPRYVASALTSELKLYINQPAISLFGKVDLLDFPGARSRIKSGSVNIEKVEKEEIADLFLRGKIDFLFQKYVENQQIDALILCIPPDPMNVIGLPQLISEWVQLNTATDGPIPPSLYFILSKFDVHLPDKPGRSDDDSVRFSNSLDTALLQPFGLSKKSWIFNWNGKRFKNVFPIRNPNFPIEGFFEYEFGQEVSVVKSKLERLNQLREGFTKSEVINNHVKDSDKKWSSLISPADGGVKYLAKELSNFDFQESKESKNGDLANSVIRSMLDTLKTFEFSDDITNKIKDEHTQFLRLWPSLKQMCETDKFTDFIDSFLISEDRLKPAMVNRPKNIQIIFNKKPIETENKVDQVEFLPSFLKQNLEEEESVGAPDIGISSMIKLTRSEFFAKVIVDTWSEKIFKIGTNSESLDRLGINAETWEYVCRHLSHPNVADHLRATILKEATPWDFSDKWRADVSIFAKIGCEVINNYVADLEMSQAEVRKSTINPSLKTFTDSLKSNEEVLIWQIWMNKFGELIESNTSSGNILECDSEQNQNLIHINKSLETLEL